ncbi:MAG: repeat containing protein [Acidobacteria bacterium]|jgi:tetratricopeptide (TPR) repeat protein|nr:repeat containing protein [Acidobacteriota bacterium]
MKKVFFTLSTSALLLFQLGCTGGEASNNSNQSNINAAETPAAEIVQATPAAAETPLPEFTDANEALTEGVKLFDANETDKAIEALKQAVKLNPDLAEAHFRLGIAYALVEREQAASTEEVELTPTPTPTPVKKGKTLEAARTDSEKSFENAVKAYKKYLVKNPKDDVAHFNLGRAYNKLNEDQDALKSLQQAVKLKPDDTEYQTELGEILIKLAQYDEAVRALKKALELDASNLPAEDLLEKAEAGKKRINFGIKPKLPEQQPVARQRQSGKPKAEPKEASTPAATEPNP